MSKKFSKPKISTGLLNFLIQLGGESMTERWTEERLDQFASTVEQARIDASKERQELREVFLTSIQVMTESNQRQEAANNAFRDAIHAMQTQFTELQADVREMQAEVRGLQVENRRILDRVFGSES